MRAKVYTPRILRAKKVLSRLIKTASVFCSKDKIINIYIHIFFYMFWTRKKFKDVSSGELRQMRLISNKMTNETLKGFKDHDVIIIKLDKKILGYCFISPFSPEHHFDNDKSALYLYNYICDTSRADYKILKPSLFLMNTLKEIYADKDLNLDILCDNARAEAFFKKNGFVYVKPYKNTKNNYLAFSYKSGGNYS